MVFNVLLHVHSVHLKPFVSNLSVEFKPTVSVSINNGNESVFVVQPEVTSDFAFHYIRMKSGKKVT